MSWWNKYSEGQITQAIENALNGGSSASLIHQASVTLDHAQLLASLTGLYEIIPPTETDLEFEAVLPSRLPVVTGGHLMLDTRGGAYTFASTGGDAGFQLVYSGPDQGNAGLEAAQRNKELQGLVAPAGVTMFPIHPLSTNANSAPLTRLDDGEFNDNGVYLWIINDFANAPADGHADNTLVIVCEFRIYDFALKKYLTTVESGWNEDTRTFS